MYHELFAVMDKTFVREQKAKAEQERQDQIQWFRSLLDSLNSGDIESCRQAIEGALELLNRDDSIQWVAVDGG